MQSNSDNNECVAAAMVAALVTRRPATNEAPSHNLMGVYLDKLKELVPQCPKNRNISKLELIQHVIDYINDLQEALQNGSDSDSPPASPSGADPVSFSEAFSHLSFDEDGSVRGLKAFTSHDEWAYGGGAAAAVYTSDGSSDYDSRGSSPINHHSDAECSSDEFSPCIPQHFSGGSPFYPIQISHMAPAEPLPYSNAPYSLASDSQRRFFRKGYGLPANHSG